MSSASARSPQQGGSASFVAVSGRDLAAMLFLALIWGLSIPATKLGLQALPPLALTTLRFAVATPLLLALTRGRVLPRAALLQVAGLGALGVGVGQVAQTFGVGGTSASVGTILSATIPLFMVIFAALRLRQPVSLRQAMGLALSFAGIATVALGQGSDGGGTTTAGVGWMLLSSVAIAFYYVWSVELARDHGVALVATWSTLFGFLTLLPWAGWEAAHSPIALTPLGLAMGAYLGALVSVTGLFIWLRVVETVSAPIAASVQYLQPVVGVLASALFFGDRLETAFLVGVAMIMAGLALVMARQGRRVE